MCSETSSPLLLRSRRRVGLVATDDRGCNCEGWHQLGASRGGGSDIVEKHLGVANQLKRSLEPLEDRAECGEMAVDVGLKQEWSELCDWERVGAPFLDGSEGKQRRGFEGELRVCNAARQVLLVARV
jgi:hypothetical protein